MKKILINISLIIALILLSASCAPGSGESNTQTPAETIEPTPTEAPMAARINGEGILLSDYEEEMLRYKDAVEAAGKSYDAAEAAGIVLDELINQTLLEQAALQDGYTQDDSQLQARSDEIANQAGGADALERWKTENHYTQESFLRALGRDMADIWMRNRILESVPKTADQVHARQILVRSENEAVAALRRLEVGTDFTSLAYDYDPLTGGDLGWFPAGFLLQPDVDTAAFSLQPGQYSGIIQTSYGFHIVYVIERDPNHPLSGEALLFEQRQALENWLADRSDQSTIESNVN